MIEEKKSMNENDIRNALMIDEKIYKKIEAVVEFFFKMLTKLLNNS